ncbi:MAG: 5-formyltetrahydrofolate cyclo-ligase [Proteobacteria bacterium]|nr:MAG: 5-formyltetrahydrofolate cyclo-ligase [Pseudomonadota bacterium]
MALTAADRREAGFAIDAHLRALPELARARRVAAYMALGDEAPLDGTIGEVLASGRVLLLPRIHGDHLEFAAVDDPSSLFRGPFGIPEPPSSAPASALDVSDVVLVPGVAFDASGGRLGRGRGFYDRVLREGAGAPLAIGVGFSFQIVARVPTQPHDRRVAGIVSERGFSWCGGRDPARDPG